MTKSHDWQESDPQATGRRPPTTPDAQHRPWGFYEVLADRRDHRVKRVTVWPGKRLSLQRHPTRSAHWHIISGDAIATVGGQEAALRPGDSVNIVDGASHRLENPGAGPLVFIEVQRGEHLGDDETEQLEEG
jgi:mannose-6-phosphate isomerase-like protein (cupin superfamily)